MPAIIETTLTYTALVVDTLLDTVSTTEDVTFIWGVEAVSSTNASSIDKFNILVSHKAGVLKHKKWFYGDPVTVINESLFGYVNTGLVYTVISINNTVELWLRCNNSIEVTLKRLAIPSANVGTTTVYQGKSAYELAVIGGFTGTVEEWLLSLKGEQGIQGDQGLAGIQGVQGVSGADGAQGVTGLSAYQLAVAGGFVGDEESWLLSLKGDAGVNGVDGLNGVAGNSAYEIAVLNGFVGTESEWLLSLKGITGDTGANGVSAYQVALANGFVGTELEWLASLKGADGVDGINGSGGAGGSIPFFNSLGNASNLALTNGTFNFYTTTGVLTPLGVL